MLDDDRVPAIEAWFTRAITGLPDPMASELRAWFEVMLRGSTQPPRSRPRRPRTVEAKLRWALPALRAWAAAGHISLREITREQVLAALPPSGTARSTTGQGLRSVFTILKAHRVIFANPAARIPHRQARNPRTAADQPGPTARRPAQQRCHPGGDRRAGRVLRPDRLGDSPAAAHRRPRRAAAPARPHRPTRRPRPPAAAYLDYRALTWPNAANPHLFIHYRTATHRHPHRPGPGRLGSPPGWACPPRPSTKTGSSMKPMPPAGDVRRLRPVRPVGLRRRALHRHR